MDKREAIAMIFTNGMLLTDENVKRLREAGLFSLMVSLDSPDADEHDELRHVPRCFERAVAGIQRCLAAGLLCGISTYATPERVRNGKVMGMVEWAVPLACRRSLSSMSCPPGGCWTGIRRSCLQRRIRGRCARWSRTSTPGGLPPRDHPGHVNGPTGAGCYASWFQYYSTAYGDITPCDFTPLAFGNIRREPLRTIWERMTATRPIARGRTTAGCRTPTSVDSGSIASPRCPFPHPVSELREEPAASAEDPEEEAGAALLSGRPRLTHRVSGIGFRQSGCRRVPLRASAAAPGKRTLSLRLLVSSTPRLLASRSPMFI